MINIDIIHFILPIVFLSMINHNDSIAAQLRICIYLVLSSLAIFVKDSAGSDQFVMIALILILLGLVLILKTNNKKDVEND